MTIPPQPVGDEAMRLALTISTAMATAAQDTAKQADAQEVTAITQAIVRLLAGVPLRCDGQLTIKSLAEEAGLKRNKLTHKHTGLKDLFYALVRARHTGPQPAGHLERENALLRETVKDLQADRRHLRGLVQQFARVVHVLEVENAQLREGSHQGGAVRPLSSGSALKVCRPAGGRIQDRPSTVPPDG
ncbi:hypothetical protein J7E91_19215 [Streptomyces sp. ISL-99]|uniref:hypothetical protein n=1 Tax=Streptomyces sp. ISL-99 TaxID=2819193 RepID=UPI001BEAECE9|nr:hypothetical protein [Streptomyces sp. ISL-99]MBT2527495.1 hypothetical protein [Streptomyces sp. ISL-99]